MPPSNPIKQGFIETIPVIFGYLPLGIAFGLMYESLNTAWYLGPLMSIVVFAGAAQFTAIPILAKGGSLWGIALTTLLVNLRHIFYGISFVGKFPKFGFKKNYMIFGLTDEAYSILTTTKTPASHHFYLAVIFFSHLYWVLGTVVGVIIGKFIHYDLSFLKFALTALFVVLTVEQAYAVRQWSPFIVAIFSLTIALIFFKSMMLFTAIIMATLVLSIKYTYETRYGNK